MALASGSRLGPYEIVSAIGAGGMGEVYRAQDPRLRREVAIKVLPSRFSADPDRYREPRYDRQLAARQRCRSEERSGVATVSDVR